MKLEPTEAQRKAMAAALPDLIVERDAREDLLEWPEIVDEMISAANSIPEGAPVGTIARRPDGGWVAHRTGGLDAPFWEYFRLDQNAPARKNQYDADSWPQIRPDQWPDQAGLDWFPPGEEPLVTRPDPDPTAQQVPKTCRICNGSGVGYGKVPGGWLETDCAACDATGEAQQEPAYTVAAASEEMAKFWDNSIVTTTKREPRVVDRLGVDERGSRWRDENGLIHSFTEGADGGRWKTQIGGSWYPWAKGVVPHGGEYTEILEPRVLPSLDCEEARDGTEWETVEELPSGGRCSYQYRPWAREWWGRSPNERRDGHPGYPFVDAVKVVGPFREVLGDPS